jgi:hypothetical protein
VSQTAIEYRKGTLSEGQAGDIHGGDRLPWVPGTPTTRDNFAPLTSRSWQVHVYGAASISLEEVCAARGLSLYTFPWSESVANVGLSRNALYLIRPDGYVALADAKATPLLLTSYLNRQGLTFAARPGKGRV